MTHTETNDMMILNDDLKFFICLYLDAQCLLKTVSLIARAWNSVVYLNDKFWIEWIINFKKKCFNNYKNDVKIPISKAKTLFKLSNDYIIYLLGNGENVINPRYKNAAPMRLYIFTNILGIAIIKYQTPALMIQKLKLKSDAKKLKQTENSKRLRTHALKTALAAKGLKIRNDSQRCQSYIDETNDVSLEEIVNIMTKMHLLYEHSVYQELLDETFNDVRLHTKNMRVSFQPYWEINKIKQEIFALELLEKAEKQQSDCVVAAANMCDCGRPHLKHMIRWNQNEVVKIKNLDEKSLAICNECKKDAHTTTMMQSLYCDEILCIDCIETMTRNGHDIAMHKWEELF